MREKLEGSDDDLGLALDWPGTGLLRGCSVAPTRRFCVWSCSAAALMLMRMRMLVRCGSAVPLLMLGRAAREGTGTDRTLLYSTNDRDRAGAKLDAREGETGKREMLTR